MTTIKQHPKHPFEPCPSGYFDTLATRLCQKINDQQETPTPYKERTQRADVVAQLTQQREIPQGYWEHFSDNMLLQIQQEKIEQNINLEPPYLQSTQLPFEPVEQQYFETFADKLIAQVKTSDSIDPNKIDAYPKRIQLPYQVPTGYFDELSGRFVAAVQTSQQNIDRTRPQFIFSSYTKIWRYAAVACVLLIGFIGIYRIQHKPETDSYYAHIQPLNESQVVAALNTMNEEDIHDHLDNYEHLVSNQDTGIEKYINVDNEDDIRSRSIELLIADVK